MTRDEVLKALEGKNILVTGGTGYIGSALIEQLCEVDCNIWQVGRDWSHLLVLWTEADIVFHLAAQTSVWKAEEDIEEDWKSNVLPMIRMLEQSKRTNHHPPIIYAGTATMFGHPVMLPVTEDHWFDPLTIYDKHKLHAYEYLHEFIGRGWAKGTMLILPNIYGPSPAKSRSKDRGVLNATIRKALMGEPIDLYEDCNRWRDWLYIDDAVWAFLCAAACKTREPYYIVGTPVASSVGFAFSIIRSIVEETFPEIRVEINSTVHPHPHPSGIDKRTYHCDATVFRAETGWRPMVKLDEGIVETIEWMVGDE